MLNRSLFEDMIDVHWVAIEEEAAERCYADHLQHGRMLLADAVAKYPESYAEIDLPEFDADERLTLDRDYDASDTNHGPRSICTTGCRQSNTTGPRRSAAARSISSTT
jgi:hypothetical protein